MPMVISAFLNLQYLLVLKVCRLYTLLMGHHPQIPILYENLVSLIPNHDGADSSILLLNAPQRSN